jgi:putative restriction endonuclease
LYFDFQGIFSESLRCLKKVRTLDKPFTTMNQLIDRYLKAFKKLRIDRSHGIAPHKPILLIALIQSYQIGQIKDQRIYITPELVALFKSIWSALATTAHDCRISYPFYYMKSEGFWKLKPKPGFSDIDKMGSLVKSFSSLNSAVDFAEIDEELFALLTSETDRRILKQFLLDEYFPDSQGKLGDGSGEASGLISGINDQIVNEPPAEYKASIRQLIIEKNDEEIFLRGSLFKREIPRIYNNRCCISGMQIDTTHNISMIDACHIVPFSESYDDTITNGIALCPNLHRAFDRGLISISQDFNVIITDIFSENKSNYSLKQFDGARIELPSNKRYWPSLENLEWHEENVFK